MHRTATSGRRRTVVSFALAALTLTISACGTGAAVRATASAPSAPRPGARCAPGARALSPPGTVLYPEVGNGGYRSLHTATHTVFDATTNRFLSGNSVALIERATQCLSSLSLDFERVAPGDPAGAPDMQVQSVRIDGAPASFRFAQPTYPGDPHGPDDPDPQAHEASQFDPVGGPGHDPLPPACSPELPREAPVVAPATSLHPEISAYETSQDGTQCPADKLVITPGQPIADGRRFTITVAYTGTPGVHHDGDGSTEGWQAERDGNWVATEPVGTEDWMPLNDYPTAKPTYEFSITTERDRTAIANGQRVGVSDNPPDADFPHGSATTRWRAPMGIPSYLALTIVGDYSMQVHTVAGVRYYAFQERDSPARVSARNALLMAEQPAITRVEAGFSGRYPFPSDGIVAGAPTTRSAEEEMESMIVLPGNGSGLVSLGGLYHENFHQCGATT